MTGLDTNILVRYIMQDDARQSPKANHLIESLDADNPGFISIVSLIELYWVLTRFYGAVMNQAISEIGLAAFEHVQRSGYLRGTFNHK